MACAEGPDVGCAAHDGNAGIAMKPLRFLLARARSAPPALVDLIIRRAGLRETLTFEGKPQGRAARGGIGLTSLEAESERA